MTRKLILPPELLQLVFSYTSNVILREKYNAVYDTMEWNCKIINKININDERYKMLFRRPIPLKLYHSMPEMYTIRRDRWYYQVYFPVLDSGKRFILRCEDDYSGNYFTAWACWKHYSDNDLDELGFVRESLHHVLYHTIK